MTRPIYYILRDRQLFSIDTSTDDALLEWARAYGSPEGRFVARTTLIDGSIVATIFLGIDANWGGSRPMLFETAMVFDAHAAAREGELCEVYQRYSTFAEAEMGHMEWVEKVAVTKSLKFSPNENPVL